MLQTILQNGHDKRSQRIFRNVLLSLLIMLLIPMLLSGLTYHEAAAIVEQQSREAKLAVLEQARDIMDNYWNDMDETSIQLSFDPRLGALFHIPIPDHSSPLQFDLWDYFKDLRARAAISDSLGNSFFLVVRTGDLVFSKDQLSGSTREFYRDVFHYEGIPYEAWYDDLFRKSRFRAIYPARQAYIDGRPTSVITYVTSLPLGSGVDNQAVIVFTVEVERIIRLFKLDEQPDSGAFAILDGSGVPITGNAGANFPVAIDVSGASHGYQHARVDGRDRLFVYAKSAYNNFTYVASLPMAEVMSKVNHIRNIATSVTLVSLIVGILISLLLASRQSKPFRELAAAFARLQGSNRHMQHALARQENALKNVFIERLFKGEFEDSAHMKAMLVYVGLDIRGRTYTAAVIHIYRQAHALNTEILEELSLLRAVFEETVRQHIGTSGLLQIMKENELAVLLLSDQTDPDAAAAEAEALFAAAAGAIKDRYLIAPIIGIGEAYSELLDVQYSFQEARSAAQHISACGEDKRTIARYSHISKVDVGYYYPTEIEIRLMNVVKAGNVAELYPLVRHLRDENFVSRNLPGKISGFLLNDLQATVMKLQNELSATERATEEADSAELRDLASAMPTDGLDKPFQAVFLQLLRLCQAVDKNKKSRNTRLLDNIVAYIGERFQDPSLSCYAVASHFNVSESYLSQFFKEQSGETFSSYVEQLRLSLARRLIAEGALSIERIAEQAGYNSTHSFRRAFKRVVGVSPSSYKELG
ncbi:MAG: helix-turn-helix domain-containing protein [Paenibacillaceae bacterium]|nr:helix-turn-helix domain-containing protein [Paenibacillaceae bacterium]